MNRSGDVDPVESANERGTGHLLPIGSNGEPVRSHVGFTLRSADPLGGALQEVDFAGAIGDTPAVAVVREEGSVLGREAEGDDVDDDRAVIEGGDRGREFVRGADVTLGDVEVVSLGSGVFHLHPGSDTGLGAVPSPRDESGGGGLEDIGIGRLAGTEVGGFGLLRTAPAAHRCAAGEGGNDEEAERHDQTKLLHFFLPFYRSLEGVVDPNRPHPFWCYLSPSMKSLLG